MFGVRAARDLTGYIDQGTEEILQLSLPHIHYFSSAGQDRQLLTATVSRCLITDLMGRSELVSSFCRRIRKAAYLTTINEGVPVLVALILASCIRVVW